MKESLLHEEEKSDQTSFGGLSLRESDMDDRFFCDKEDAPVDMEEVREGMKLVPLPDICYADEENDTIHTEAPYLENVVPMFQAVAAAEVREPDLVVKKVRTTKITAGKRKVGGAGRGFLKRMKANLLVKDSRTKAFSKQSIREVSRHIQTGGIVPVPKGGPFPDFSLWTVEDDLLLKNSMEAGAAMEALAKGAMRFSRRFTITDLRERWRALLYDPDIAAKAATRMVEAETRMLGSSKLAFPSKYKDLLSTIKNKRNRSVRTEYYKRRKSLAKEHTTWSFLNGAIQDGSKGLILHAGNQAGDTTEDHLVSMDIAPLLTGLSESPLYYCSEEGKTLNILDRRFGKEVCPASGRDKTSTKDHNLVGVENSAMPDALGQDSCLLSNHGCDLNETAEALNVVIPKLVFDPNQSVSVLSLHRVPITESPEVTTDIKDVKVDHYETPAAAKTFVGNICEAACEQEPAEVPPKLEDTVSDIGLREYIEGFEIASDALRFAEYNTASDVCASEVQECSRRTTINDELGICTLNTEYTDVPFFEDSPSPSMSSSSSLGSSGYQSESLSKLHTQGEIFESSHSLHAAEGSVGNVERMQDDEHNNAISNFCSASLCEESIKSHFVGPISNLSETKGSSVKRRRKISPRRSSSMNLVHSNMELLNPHLSETQTNCNTHINPVTLRFQTKKGACSAKCTTSRHESSVVDCAFGTALDTSSSSILWQTKGHLDVGSSDAELQIRQTPNGMEDNYQNHEIEDEPLSDEELASFSDVEALILDMDLDPGDDDFSARAESRRTYRSHRKALVRLEQAANSAMQRALMSCGSIAILYGHLLRYFMTKNEVIIGRFTQDNVVDIDLGKEGRANKVSRRQASIKLKEDGVFYLKNLGRRVLYVNNIGVETSQRASLNSACLIEVGGMRFVFEINKKLVKKRIKEMMSSSYDE